MKILDINSPTFAEDFESATGIKPGDPIEIATPQFHRTDGVQINAPDLTEDEWKNLSKIPLERIRQLGCQVWDDTEKGIHWLFPGEWYPYIPDGLDVLCINGDVKKFQRGVADDDIRFGALAYGFMTN